MIIHQLMHICCGKTCGKKNNMIMPVIHYNFSEDVRLRFVIGSEAKSSEIHSSSLII